MISLATSAGRYLPSADWAKRRCSEPTARAAVPTPTKASSQPTPQPKAGRSIVSTPDLLEQEGKIAEDGDLDDEQPARASSRASSTRLVSAPATTTPERRDPQRPARDRRRHPAVEQLGEHMGVDLEALRPAAGGAARRRLVIVEVLDVAADQHVAALDQRTHAVGEFGDELDRQVGEHGHLVGPPRGGDAEVDAPPVAAEFGMDRRHRIGEQGRQVGRLVGPAPDDAVGEVGLAAGCSPAAPAPTRPGAGSRSGIPPATAGSGRDCARPRRRRGRSACASPATRRSAAWSSGCAWSINMSMPIARGFIAVDRGQRPRQHRPVERRALAEHAPACRHYR